LVLLGPHSTSQRKCTSKISQFPKYLGLPMIDQLTVHSKQNKRTRILLVHITVI
jgi:hypothetical protein